MNIVRQFIRLDFDAIIFAIFMLSKSRRPEIQ